MAERRLADFNSQDLVNTAWAFAKGSQSDAELFTMLARAAKWCMGNFNVQTLANTVWAFATVDHADAQLFTVLARVVERCVG